MVISIMILVVGAILLAIGVATMHPVFFVPGMAIAAFGLLATILALLYRWAESTSPYIIII